MIAYRTLASAPNGCIRRDARRSRGCRVTTMNDDEFDVMTDEREGAPRETSADRKRRKMLRFNTGLDAAVDDLLSLVRDYGMRALPAGASAILGRRPITPVTIVELAVRLTAEDARRRLERAARATQEGEP